MKVFFIQARNKKEDRFVIHPPYGLMYLASVLRNSSIEVQIYDANIKPQNTNDFFFQEIKEVVEQWQPDVIGIGGMTSSFCFFHEIAKKLKAAFPEIPLIGGGLIISAMPEVIMRQTVIDAGCIGEAEETIVDLVNSIVKRLPLDQIPNLILRQKDGEFLLTSGKASLNGRKKRTLESLDQIPLPSYDLIDLKAYLPHQSFCGDLLRSHFHRKKLDPKQIEFITPYAMPLFAGRGCPFNCIFCFSTMDKKPTKHSVDYVIKHLEYLEKQYGINHFQFLDENFNFNRDWVIEFCNKIISQKKNYFFTTGNRNRAGFFDKEMLELMKKANFYETSVGVESLDDEMLSEMGRCQVSDNILSDLKMIKEVGIEQEHIRCLFGFPSDSKKTIFSTIKKGNSIGYKTLFALVIPLPGTKLFHKSLEKGIIKNELDYLEELFSEDGYRNLTSFNSLHDVQKIIYRANNYSQRDYLWRNKSYLAWLNHWMLYAAKELLLKLLEVTKLKNYVKSFLSGLNSKKPQAGIRKE